MYFLRSDIVLSDSQIRSTVRIPLTPQKPDTSPNPRQIEPPVDPLEGSVFCRSNTRLWGTGVKELEWETLVVKVRSRRESSYNLEMEGLTRRPLSYQSLKVRLVSTGGEDVQKGCEKTRVVPEVRRLRGKRGKGSQVRRLVD